MSNDNQVCKLNKALYGLKRAARCWHEIFERTLEEKSFKNSAFDSCIYILDRGNIMENIYLVLYVDDLVIVTLRDDTMKSIKNYLMNKFQMVDFNDIKLFIGIRIIRTENKIILDQNTYIKSILNKFNMNGCHPVSTPLEIKIDQVACL